MTGRALGQRVRRIAAPTIAALLALAVLIGLGSWQLQRKAWKEGLLAQIEARAYGSPAEAPAEASWPEWRQETDEYRRVRLSGAFMGDRTISLHGLAEVRRGLAAQGFYLFTPLRREDGSVVIVNRGFVPTEAHAETFERLRSATAGRVDLVGLVRAPEAKAAFVPANDPASGTWFVRDLAEMVRHAGVERAAPFYVDQDATPQPGGWPRGGQTQLLLRNAHLQYAVTWFGLAATLLGVYGMFAWRRWRGVDSSTGELQPDDAGDDERDAAKA